MHYKASYLSAMCARAQKVMPSLDYAYNNMIQNSLELAHPFPW